MQLSWQELAQATGGNFLVTDLVTEQERLGLGTDTRKDLRGQVFLALAGANFDGHNYLAEALQAGASGLIVEDETKAFQFKEEVPILLVTDTRQALQDFAQYYLRKLGIPKLVVTGSVGKTSTRDTISHLLSKHFKVHKNKANINNRLGVAYTILETPEDAELLVLEAGLEAPGDLQAISQVIEPSLCLLTNIGTAHIEKFGSRQALAKGKAEILEAQVPGGALLINADDPYLVQIASREALNRPVFFISCGEISQQLRTSLPEDPQFSAAEIAELKSLASKYQGTNLFPSCPAGTSLSLLSYEEQGDNELCLQLELSSAEEKQELELLIPAMPVQQIQNLVYALAVAYTLGLSLEDLNLDFSDFELSKGRQDLVYLPQNTLLINDAYNASPESMRAAFFYTDQVAQQAQFKKRIAILASVLELGTYSDLLHEQIGEAAGAHNFSAYYLLGEGSRHMLKGIKAHKSSASCSCFTSKAELLAQLLAEDLSQSLILLKGSRHFALEDLIPGIREALEE